MDSKSVISLRGVSKSYGDKKVLHGICLDLERGKIYGIIGKSGCGKTTLLNIIMGYLKPSMGDIYFNNENITKVGNRVKQVYGFASQKYSFYPKMSVNENLSYFGKLYGMNKKQIEERTHELLGYFKLHGEQSTLGQNLSSGMQKRLDIACALIHDPEVLLLDEPTADLDPVLRKEILMLIKQINNSGKTIIVTTHLLGEIDFICDNVFLIHNQQLKNMGTPSSLSENFLKEVFVRLQSKEYSKLIQGLKLCPINVEGTRMQGRDLIIETKTPEILMPYLVAYANKHGDVVEHMSITKPSLDAIFEELTK